VSKITIKNIPKLWNNPKKERLIFDIPNSKLFVKTAIKGLFRYKIIPKHS
jgi:hypothetical protein